jgi:hypothetical protein
MERTWVGRDLMPPRYPPAMWNNKDITLEQMPKASNSIESWHNTFTGIFNRHASNPYNLVRALLDKQVFIFKNFLRPKFTSLKFDLFIFCNFKKLVFSQLSVFFCKLFLRTFNFFLIF